MLLLYSNIDAIGALVEPIYIYIYIYIFEIQRLFSYLYPTAQREIVTSAECYVQIDIPNSSISTRSSLIKQIT